MQGLLEERRRGNATGEERGGAGVAGDYRLRAESWQKRVRNARGRRKHRVWQAQAGRGRRVTRGAVVQREQAGAIERRAAVARSMRSGGRGYMDRFGPEGAFALGVFLAASPGGRNGPCAEALPPCMQPRPPTPLEPPGHSIHEHREQREAGQGAVGPTADAATSDRSAARRRWCEALQRFATLCRWHCCGARVCLHFCHGSTASGSQSAPHGRTSMTRRPGFPYRWHCADQAK